jgi:hypothetical protein
MAPVPEVRTIVRKTTQLIHGKETTIRIVLISYIRVIGDKRPCNLSPDVLDTIHRTLQTAVKSIIPVRNPFDLISTGVLYQDTKGLVDVFHRQFNVPLSKKLKINRIHLLLSQDIN